MKGDFSRDTFDPSRHYSRVLLQQGRVQLDADWNEQVAIQTHALRALARDLIGPDGGPEFGAGFALSEGEKEGFDFAISPGSYYVAGIRCENVAPPTGKGATYLSQPYWPKPKTLEAGHKYLAYLDVWERDITATQDPRIREVALGGPDTAVRAQIVWRVGIFDTNEVSPASYPKDETVDNVRKYFEENWSKPSPNAGKLRAKTSERSSPSDKDCYSIPPDARFRGVENQLYRVEIQRGGDTDKGQKPTFRWSRDNGSVVFPIQSITLPDASTDRLTVKLVHLGRDERSTLVPGDSVELTDDDIALDPGAGEIPLFRVVSVDRAEGIVTLLGKAMPPLADARGRHPLLRRWERPTGDGGKSSSKDALQVVEAETPFALEDGIQVEFSKGRYNAGDYWLIPARTATGDIWWPYETTDPRTRAWLPAKGIIHYYAPLGVVEFEVGGGIKNGKVLDLRRQFKALTSL